MLKKTIAQLTPIRSLLRPAATRLLSSWVRPDVLPEEPADLLPFAVPVLYVLESGGIADRAALDIVCKQYGLPRASDALYYGDVHLKESVAVLKKRRHRFAPRSGHKVSKSLQAVAKQASISNEECIVVPVSVYWGREPDRDDSFWKVLFSENWEVAGRTRKFFVTLVHGRHTLLRFSDPISLKDLTGSEESSEIVHRKLSRILRVHFRQRRIASLGPDLSHRRMLIRQVVTDPDVRQAIAANLTEPQQTQHRLEQRANDYAHEIAADVSYRTIRVLHHVLTRLWTRLYDGVELSGLERLDMVAEGREIVYVPCHRSHIDYLLLSYILYVNGYSLPHIAAGINLNLPVAGGVLRRGGAFFLRRTFAGNRLYAAVFNTYLKELLQRGHALEYFIEGGRSRTGLLLSPKGGMLSMTVQAYLHEPARPVVFVPVYFGYERLLEGRAFTSELAGGKKKKESLLGLFKGLKTLREQYGHVHVNIGQPIDLPELLDSHNPDWRNDRNGPGSADKLSSQRADWLKPVVSELGTKIMQNINAAAGVTPISLLAISLLASPRETLGRPELERQINTARELIRLTHADSLVTVSDMPVAEIITLGMSLGFIQSSQDELGELLSVKRDQVSALTYFRNNIAHLLVLPSLIASVFSSNRSNCEQALRDMVGHAWPFLQADFFLPEELSDETIDRCFGALKATGLLISVAPGRWGRARAGSSDVVLLIRLAEIIAPVVERYYLTASVLAIAGDTGLSRERLEEHCRIAAKRLSVTEGRGQNDLYDKSTFQTLLDRLEMTGGVLLKDGKLVLADEMKALESEIRGLLAASTRHAILAAAQSPLMRAK